MVRGKMIKELCLSNYQDQFLHKKYQKQLLKAYNYRISLVVTYYCSPAQPKR